MTFSLFLFLNSTDHYTCLGPSHSSPFTGKCFFNAGLTSVLKSSKQFALHRKSTGINLCVNLVESSPVSFTVSTMVYPTRLTSTWGYAHSASLINMAPGTCISNTNQILLPFFYMFAISSYSPFIKSPLSAAASGVGLGSFDSSIGAYSPFLSAIS